MLVRCTANRGANGGCPTTNSVSGPGIARGDPASPDPPAGSSRPATYLPRAWRRGAAELGSQARAPGMASEAGPLPGGDRSRLNALSDLPARKPNSGAFADAPSGRTASRASTRGPFTTQVRPRRSGLPKQFCWCSLDGPGAANARSDPI